MGAKANHHYVPQFYLRNFAEGVGRQARVVFFDNDTLRLGHTLVRNVGSQRYFNRIEAEGTDPDYLEDALAKLEGEMASMLAEVIAARAFPSDEHFTYLMNLIALLSVRNPRLRGQMERFHQDVAERVLGIVTSSKDIWEHQIQKMKDDGVKLGAGVSYEEAKRFRDEKRYTIGIDRTHLIGVEFEMVPTVLETLANRNWCFASAPNGSQYITSDDPVVLEWADSSMDGPYPAGHGLRGTRIVFPISSEVVLVGQFEDVPERIHHNEVQVTSVNTVIARNSRRQIYAKTADFRVNLLSHPNVAGADLPQHF